VIPTQVIARGEVDFCALFQEIDCFGAIVLDGMLLQRVAISEHTSLRLLGPSDLVSLTSQSGSMLVSDGDCRVLAKTRVALLGREMLAGSQRWPQLVAGLHVRLAEQSQRVVAQLAICQLPRVDQRLMSIMWLLAESWGRVTTAGTSVPLNLTHDVLGGLVGARRSTVTLALGELAERGALIRQAGGWLLLEPPPSYEDRLPPFEELQVLQRRPSPWRANVGGRAAAVNPAYLRETVERLREEHRRNKEQVHEQLERLKRTRSRVQRRRSDEAAVTRRPAPS
jgi:CRP-like cAMP-binding protein